MTVEHEGACRPRPHGARRRACRGPRRGSRPARSPPASTRRSAGAAADSRSSSPRARGLDTVALTGGVFQNVLLTEVVETALRAPGLEVLVHRASRPTTAASASAKPPSPPTDPAPHTKLCQQKSRITPAADAGSLLVRDGVARRAAHAPADTAEAAFLEDVGAAGAVARGEASVGRRLGSSRCRARRNAQQAQCDHSGDGWITEVGRQHLQHLAPEPVRRTLLLLDPRSASPRCGGTRAGQGGAR